MVACAVKLSPPIALSYFTRAFRTSTGVPTLVAVAASPRQGERSLAQSFAALGLPCVLMTSGPTHLGSRRSAERFPH
jgi:hypothetical protein